MTNYNIELDNATAEQMLYDEPEWDCGVGDANIVIKAKDGQVYSDLISYEMNYDTRNITLADHNISDIKEKFGDDDDLIRSIAEKIEDYYE
ncbi:hypothetical protein HNO53_13055 [Billgrantia antri]|uniref:Phage protein n=1 Tax=Halomonas sulfidivorans TaxID=2733488 RepID=A0ABX7WL45_9GAMM|nr:hypothetical protein [Halomonas sulfidivorans]QTP59564.1 hypothetical protein HNO53_13055 [Halomonas sulfidivorans]